MGYCCARARPKQICNDSAGIAENPANQQDDDEWAEKRKRLMKRH